jgi:TfoX/Sxy family transcriptional regulator of competence genes
MIRPKRHASHAAAGAADVLADRLRAALPATGVTEQRMFGGIGFMLDGNMIAGCSKRGLLLRVGKDRNAAALARPGARAMEMRGRPVEGYVTVDPAGLDDVGFRDWIALAVGFVRSLPPKSARQGRGKAARQ